MYLKVAFTYIEEFRYRKVTCLGRERGICLHFLKSRELRYCRRRDRRQSTVHRTAEFIFQIPYSRHIKKDHIHKDVVFFMCLENTLDAIRFYSNLNFHSSNSIMSITSSRVFCLPKILFNPAPFTFFAVTGAARPYGREFTQLMQRRTDNSL